MNTDQQQLRATQITVANLFYQKILDQLKAPNLSPRDLKSLTASFQEVTRTLYQHDIVQQGWERVKLAREASERFGFRKSGFAAPKLPCEGGSAILPLSAGGEGQGEVVLSSPAIGTRKSQIENSLQGEVVPAPATSCSNPDSGSSSLPSLPSVKSTPVAPPLATDHRPLTTLESLGISPEAFNAKVDEILNRPNAADMTRNSAARNAHKELEHELRFKAMDAGTPLTYDQYFALKVEAGMDPAQAEIISHRQIVTDQSLLEKRQQRKASQAACLAKAA